MIWREKSRLLIALGTFLVLNAIFFLTYRVRYKERVTALSNKLEASSVQLQEARAARTAAERQIAAYNEVLQTIDQVYTEWWATPEERLTALILEIRKLAAKSQLRPPSVSYNHAASSLKGEPTSTLSISFGVQGSYHQVRKFINMLELSPQFVIIDELGLSGPADGGSTLQFSIQLKTLFRETEARAKPRAL